MRERVREKGACIKLENIVILQSLNIVILIAITVAQAWVGFIALFFGSFFILFVQLPLFFLLRSKKRKKLKFYKDHHIAVDWRFKHSSWLVVGICFIALYAADVLFGFSVDPFTEDNFQIEVTLNSDKTCKIIFDGNLVSDKMIYQYQWKQEQEIYCHSVTGSSSVLINLGLPKGELPQVGLYPLTAELDTRGYPIGYGGAFFNDLLGYTHNPSSSGTVFWDFVSGTFAIESVTQLRNKNMIIIVGKLEAIGKRHHRGP